jgi:hypothetical protein
MASSDTQSLHALDDEHLWMLAVLVHGVYGPDLTRTQFNDVMLGLSPPCHDSCRLNSSAIMGALRKDNGSIRQERPSQ